MPLQHEHIVNLLDIFYLEINTFLYKSKIRKKKCFAICPYIMIWNMVCQNETLIFDA